MYHQLKVVMIHAPQIVVAVLACAFVGCGRSSSQSASGAADNMRDSLSVAEMEADLESLVSHVQAIHPATVEGMPPAVERAIREARGRVQEPLRRPEFWLVANQVLRALGDSHTSMASPSGGGTSHCPLPGLKTGCSWTVTLRSSARATGFWRWAASNCPRSLRSCARSSPRTMTGGHDTAANSY